MSEFNKLTYEDFKNKYLSKIPQKTIDEVEKLHGINYLKEIMEQDAQKQYEEYCFRWENNKRWYGGEKTKFPQELSDLLDSATTSCKILPTFNKDEEGDLSVSICFNGISIILNDNGTWLYSKPTNS